MVRYKHLGLALAALTVALASRSANATTNLFTPVSGTSFHGADLNTESILIHEVGYTMNNTGGGAAWVEASLGHAQGFSNGFTFVGNNNGMFLYCDVLVQNETTVSILAYSNTTSVSGFYAMPVATAPTGGPNYFYTGRCFLPQPNGSGIGSALYGVRPDH